MLGSASRRKPPGTKASRSMLSNMIPHPTDDDLLRDPVADHERFTGYSFPRDNAITGRASPQYRIGRQAAAWIRRAVHAEAEVERLRSLTGGLADRIAAQAELLAKRAGAPYLEFREPPRTIESPITSKKRMYELLTAGALGNTLPAWFDLDEWQADPDAMQHRLWGIRSLQSGNKHMKLDVPRDEVPRYVREYHSGVANITPMIDEWSIFRCEVVETKFEPFGLRVFGTDACARTLKWREALRETGREWLGVQAVEVLRRYLSANDYDDVCLLLDRYPGHVIEMTVCDREVGKIPGRRAVIWEVRAY